MAKAPNAPAGKKRKRPAIHRSKSPSQVPPILFYAVFVLVVVMLTRFGILSERTAMLLTSCMTLLFVAFISVFQVYFKLKFPIVKIILAVVFPVWLLGSGYILFSAIVLFVNS